MVDTLPTPSGQERIVYKGKLIEIVEQDVTVGQKQFTIEKARRAPGVRLIIVSPDKKILLTKEYRMELKEWDTRLPGGKVFDTLEEYNKFLQSGQGLGIKAVEAAKKEAREEVGLEVKEMTYFAVSHCGATIDWDLYYFVVTDYKENLVGQKLEVGENIQLIWVSLDEAGSLCFSGKIGEDRSAAVLLRYLATVQK